MLLLSSTVGPPRRRFQETYASRVTGYSNIRPQVYLRAFSYILNINMIFDTLKILKNLSDKSHRGSPKLSERYLSLSNENG